MWKRTLGQSLAANGQFYFQKMIVSDGGSLNFVNALIESKVTGDLDQLETFGYSLIVECPYKFLILMSSPNTLG